MSKSNLSRTIGCLVFIATSGFILVFSLLRQSEQQAQLRLGLSAPELQHPNQSSVEIVVPRHGNFSLTSPILLPSNPLYPFKMIYDRVRLLTTLNPQRKLMLLLEYSNARMSAANRLIDQGDTSLAITTATKGQNYLWQTIHLNHSVVPHDPNSWFNLISQSILKHEEIIEKLQFVSVGQPRNQANILWDQLEYYRGQIVSLSGAPFKYPRPEDKLTP